MFDTILYLWPACLPFPGMDVFNHRPVHKRTFFEKFGTMLVLKKKKKEKKRKEKRTYQDEWNDADRYFKTSLSERIVMTDTHIIIITKH